MLQVARWFGPSLTLCHREEKILLYWNQLFLTESLLSACCNVLQTK